MSDPQELGAVFYRARMRQNISLEDLEQQTKIRRRFLLAIEEGRFEEVPAEVYLKGFLRSYARAVRLDPEEVVSQYYHLNSSEPDEAEAAPSEEVQRHSVRRRKAKQRKRQRIAFAVIVLLALAAGAAYYFWNSVELL